MWRREYSRHLMILALWSLERTWSQCITSCAPSTIKYPQTWTWFLAHLDGVGKVIIVTYSVRLLATTSSQQIVLWTIKLMKGISYALCTMSLLLYLQKPPTSTPMALGSPLYPPASPIPLIPLCPQFPVLLPKYHLGNCCSWSNR